MEGVLEEEANRWFNETKMREKCTGKGEKTKRVRIIKKRREERKSPR